MIEGFLSHPCYREDIQKSTFVEIDWSKLNNKKILISGATGMIASVIIDIIMERNKGFEENIQVIAISRNEEKARKRFKNYLGNTNFKYLSHEVEKPLEEIGEVDYVLHAASNTHPLAYSQDPIGTITANVEGTRQLLEYASSHHANRFLFFSSVEIYGENRRDVEVFDEAYMGYLDCNTLRAGYPESKRLGEALCNAYGAQKGQEFIIARLSRVYGPTMSQQDSKAIAQFIRKAVQGEDIVLKSDGSQYYSYTYVVDAAMAIFYILLYGESGSAINVADRNSDITMKSLAELLAEEANVKVKIEAPSDIERRGYSKATRATLDAKKLVKLGWQPQTSINQGIKKTVQVLASQKKVCKQYGEVACKNYSSMKENEVIMKEKVIIFGLGQNFKMYHKFLLENYDIVCYTDNDWSRSELAKPFIQPSEIVTLDYDRIIICAVNFSKSIREQLVVTLNINSEKILDILDCLEDCAQQRVLKSIDDYKLRYRDDLFPLQEGNMWLFTRDYFAEAGSVDSHYFLQDIWGAKKIREANPLKHYDIGSRLESFIAHLLVFRKEVFYIDIRPLSDEIEGLKFVQGDATNLENIPDNSIESLSSFHALEHFGLGRYGDPVDPYAYEKAIRAFIRVLKPGGRLYLGVPIGPTNKLVFNAHRIFDPRTIIEKFEEGMNLIDFAVIKENLLKIQNIPIADIEGIVHTIPEYSCGLFEFVKRSN